MISMYQGLARQRHLNGPRWPFSLNRQSIQARNLVACYPMLAWETDAKLRDLTDNARHIVTVGSAPVLNGRSSLGRPSMTFDGVDDYCELQRFDTWMTASDGAWSCWARPLSNAYEGASPGYEIQGVFAENGGYVGIVVGDYGGATGQAFHAYCYDGGNPIVSSSVINIYEWYHVMATLGGGNLSLYINGKSVGSTATSGPQVISGLLYLANGYGGITNIEIADARIYSTKPSDDAIWQMYDPRTRWELYRPVRDSIMLSDVEVVAGGATLVHRNLLLGVGI